MKLNTLNNSIFAPLKLNEAASVLGGQAAAAAAGTFKDCYTFFSDGTYRSDDKDQDAAEEVLA
ncbi:MAG TPA: hypothetical protein VF432_09520 [Thermoanaerobaculia bacterium]